MIPSWYTIDKYGEITAGRFHYEQAVELKKFCNIAIFYPFDQDIEEEFAKKYEGGVLTWRSKSWKGKRLKSNINLCKSFHKVVKTFKPDICFVQVASEAGRSASVLCKLYSIPMVLAEHSSPEALGLVKGGKIKDYLLLKFVYSQCACVTCVSRNLTNVLHHYYPKLEIFTVYNGIQPATIIDEVVDSYRMNGAINAVIVGGFYNMEIKGYQYLLPAIKKVIQKGYKIVLHICGDGECKRYYENMAKKLDIAQQCIFHGQCSRKKVYTIVEQSDFFVSASIFESAGMAIQEAMLLGKPVLVTNSGGADSLVTKETGIVVEKGSVQSPVDGLEKMIDIYEKFDVTKIKEYAKKNFEIGHVTEQYIKIFNNILKK